MAFLHKVDDALLGLCTRVAHAFQMLTGKTNFFIAKVGITIAAATVVLDIGNHFYPILHREDSGVMIAFGLMIIPFFYQDAMHLDEVDRSHLSEERVAVKGHTDRSSFLKRIVWLFFSGSDTLYVFLMLYWIKDYKLIDSLDSLGYTYGVCIFYYFAAVEPLRPQKSKIRQWVEKFSSAPPEPVPFGSKG